MSCRFLVLLPLLLAAAPVAAQNYDSRDEARYRNCLTQTRLKPADAFESALAWRDAGGGAPALHCAAMALIELKQFRQAAERLEKLADLMEREGSPLTPDMLGQAGNAWLLANAPDRAYQVFSAGLALVPDHVELLIDRGRSLGMQGDWAGAKKDLDHALQLAPDREDAYAFRASARRQAGDKEGALEDVETALAIRDDDVDALLERGILRLAKGDKAGARADWLKVRLLAPNTPAADAAGKELELLDVKVP